VTLAFGRQHVLDSLKPPTETEEGSPICTNRKYVYSQQILTDRKLRELVRKIMAMPMLPELLKGGGDEEETPEGRVNEEEDSARAKAAGPTLDHIHRVELASQKMTALNKGLGTIFTLCYGVDAYRRQTKPTSSYQRLFRQVRRHVISWIWTDHLPYS
jgi:hypothetical protein